MIHQMLVRKFFFHCAFLAFMCGVFSLSAEVVLSLKGGKKIIGEAIIAEDDTTYTIRFYREFVRKIPKEPVTDVKVIPFAGERELAEIRKAYSGGSRKDVTKRLKMHDALLEKDLTLEAAAVLFELQHDFPENKKIQQRVVQAYGPQERTFADKAFLEQCVREYFSKKENRADLLRTLCFNDFIPDKTVNSWAEYCFERARKGKRVQAGDSVFVSEKPGFKGNIHIELWRKKGIKKTADEKWPVLIALHGGGRNKGHWKLGGPTFFNCFKNHFDRLILVAPTVLRKRYAEWAGNPLEEYYVHEAFRAVKRTWNVDTNRVFLAGVSMGAYGTWHIGGHRPDCFAGLVSNAGGILIGTAHGHTWGWGIIGNLMHTPIAFIHGGKDKPAPPWSDAQAHLLLSNLGKRYPGKYKHKYISDPNWGHAVPGHSIAAAVKWIAPHIRDPLPRKILWEPKWKHNPRFYWLKLDRPRLFTRIEAEIKGNTVSIKTHKIFGGLSVFLNNRLVDLKKPVTVIVNGRKVYAGMVRPRLCAILESVHANLDPEQWFSARLDF